MASQSEQLPLLLCPDQAFWESWLEENGETSPGVRLHIAKKQSGVVSVTYAEALESSLCYGWIDSRKEAYDDKTWVQRFTPRGPRSIWSKVNKEKVERLIAEGRMKPKGLQAIEAAKRNGQWEAAYAPQSSATVPDDFAAALQAHPQAKAFFEGLNNQNRYAMLFRIQQVKRPETRAKKIAQFIDMLEKGEKIHLM
ncbi:YdeI/OmpD-associated family protein [Paenibacillus thalictri]|uniref:Bacteriocin-protection protein n=1 Tax=Paenibacillus thalictri TaxID=2527873 RepID=A0A4V6MSJ2_9BACL|nr:YdeI/OmpD-associated family protein [Paenibacillus thalictri]TBL81172.1 bacteriocin-protection protein [Paenibacillus thalictri]